MKYAINNWVYADVLGYLHMSENHRGLIGTGTVNWDELFKGLAAAQISAPLVLESFSENSDWELVT